MSDATSPGKQMEAEMREQPARVHDALTATLPKLDTLARAVKDARVVVLLGRGSSRSASTFGARALRTYAQRLAIVGSPAELAWGEWGLPLGDALVIAVSQSGESREMVAAAERARDLGARLIVVTNSPSSTLAAVAIDDGDVVECLAGPEVAVPATKSFTTSAACLLAIAAASQPDDVRRARDELPELMQRIVDSGAGAELDFGGIDGFALAGEGYGEAIAEEAAIKLRETLILPAASFETSEFLHGSINSSAAGMGVITIETDELTAGLSGDVVQGANQRGATTVHIGATPIPEATHHIALPQVLPAWSAMLAILPIQRVARENAVRRDLDPDTPAGLSKVTLIDYEG